MQLRSTVSCASRSNQTVVLGISIFRFSSILFRGVVVALLAIVSVAAPQGIQAQCTNTQSGLIALYPNNGSPSDLAGYNYGFNNGTLVNAPTYVNNGGYSAIQLNGANNQFMQLPNGMVQDVGTFSVSVWFQTTSRGALLGVQNATLDASNANPTLNNGPYLYVGTDSKLYAALASSNSGRVSVSAPGQGSNGVADGNWHHAVLVVTTSPATESLYLDGALAGTASAAQWLISQNNQPFNLVGMGYTLNYTNGNPGWFGFTGLIGEVALYNRALTQTDVTNLFLANANGVCTPTPVSVTANADSVTSGNTSALTLSYTASPLTPNWVPAPSCYSSANGASQLFPAFYQNAINCYGAVASGYAFTYGANTLTLGNPTAGSDPIIEPDAYVAQPYQQAASIPNATPSSTYSLSGTTPPGIGINASNGVLYGFATKAGDYNFTVNWTDGTNSGTQPVRLKVLPGFGSLITATSDSTYVNGKVYRVDPNTGIMTTLASVSTNVVDVAVDPSTGRTYALSTTGTVYAITSSGTVSTFYSNASLGNTYAIAVDTSSDVYVASMTQIYKLNSSGVLVNVQGNPITGPLFANPVSGSNSPRMIFDRDGNLLVSGQYLGNAAVSSSILTGAQINTSYIYTAATGNIQGMTFARDGSGDLILADAANNSLIRVSQLHAANIATTIMTSASAFSPGLVGVVAGNAAPFNEYYVGMTTGTGTFKVVPQTSELLGVVTAYPQTHQTAITWFGYNQPAITIQAPPTAFNVGTTYSFNLQASGGSGTYTWSQTGFPPGLTLSPSGAVSGTPTTAGTYTVTIQVSDTNGNSGGGTYNITVSSGSQALLIVANPQVMTYGGALPTPTFTESPTGVVLGTQPSCIYSGLPSPLNVGTYQGVITCSGAAASGYTISYASGNLTVNPATLTVTANSFVTPYGTALPTLTASVTGFVNNDSLGTATTGAPALSVNVPAGNPAGVYTITASQGTLAANNNNYTFTFINGTLTITPVQQTPSLNLLNNYIITGDYVARGIDGAFTTSSPGYVGTTITIPSLNQATDGIPNGAEVVAAYLYWQSLENASVYPSTAPGSLYAMFNGYNIYGTPIAPDLTTGCWTTAAPGYVLRSYRSNVTAFLPVDPATGSYKPVWTHAVSLPQLGSNGYGYGASLVVIYRLMAPNSQMKATVVYDGNWSQEYPPGNTAAFNLNLAGFYDSNQSGGPARFTDITGFANTNGTFSFTPATSQTTSLALPDASASVAMPNNFQALQSGQCRLWSATIVSTPVHSSDADGLIDSWKTAQGYTDVLTGTWVGLAGAQAGHHDLFVQLDYMVGADGHSHQPSATALTMVQQSLTAHGVTPHFITGNAIPEQTCTTDNTSVTPPLYCVFPNEPGVVEWKVGLEDLKTEAVDPSNCTTYDPANAACQPRFPYGRRNSYHYALFGHSLGIANWSIHDGTLLNISVASNVGTVNLSPSTPFKTCPSRVTITNAMVRLELNGTYTVNSCNSTNTGFTITTVNVPDGSYPSTTGPPETALAIVNGTTSSISGYSDVGGSDSVITLGKWGSNGTRDNVVAGTFMHELGHTLGLGHGGAYNGYGTLATYGPNCKPNYQSVMNYLFQIDLLGPSGVVDYSSEALSSLDKTQLGNSTPIPYLGLTTTISNTVPMYSTTNWYSPFSPYGIGSPATRQCNGVVPPPGVYGYLVNGASYPIPWFANQDINFDGSTTEMLAGYNDWAAVDLRQVGSTGHEVLVYPVGIADGGIQLSGGGGIQLSGGGGIQLSGGGGIQRTGGGGIQLSGGGGIQLSGGGGIQLAGGGGIQLSGGGGIQLSGGGGIQLSGGGGIQLAGGGGIQLSGGGGVDAELTFATADAVVRPPRNVTTTGNVITWNAALFGTVLQYNIYRSTNGGPLVLLASVAATAGPPYSYTDASAQAGTTYTYFVTTVLTDGRESSTPNPAPTLKNQTITFPNPGPLYFTTQGVALQATATSGLSVTYMAGPSGVCSVSGSTLQFVSAGTCNVTASQAGGLYYNPAPKVTIQVVINPWTIVGFTSPVVMSNPSIVWNVIKAGQTVPLKFNVYIGTVQQTSTAVVVGQTVSLTSVACVTGATNTDTSVTNTGNTSLRWDGTEFIQNWQTPSGGGKCYAATVQTLDGSKIVGYFQTK